MNIEQEHLDVLQNIESAIQSVYRQNKQFLDYDVEAAINALIMDYQHEVNGNLQVIKPANLDVNKKAIYEAVRQIMEVRLGRPQLTEAPELPIVGDIDLDIALAALKRIRKSIRTWTKREGRQGYLNFTGEFLP